MTADTHQLDRETFSALAAGGGGPSAIRLLSDVSYSKLLLLILGVLRRADDHPDACDAERAYDLLATVQEKAPDEVEIVLRHPSVRAWARHAAQALTARATDDPRPGTDPVHAPYPDSIPYPGTASVPGTAPYLGLTPDVDTVQYPGPASEPGTPPDPRTAPDPDSVRHPGTASEPGTARYLGTAPDPGTSPTPRAGVGGDPDLGRLAVVAAAAAIRAQIPCTVEVCAPGGVLVLPSLGRALLRHERAVIDVSSGGAEIRCLAGSAVAAPAGTAVDRVMLPVDRREDPPGWRGLRRLSAVSQGRRIELLIDDVDPYRMPAMADLAGPLTDRQVGEWQSVLEPAWDILVRDHPATADEVRTALHVVTPLRPPAHGQVSATGRDTFGCIAMSAPVDAQSFAETLAHEVGHTKLTALLDIVQLTLPDDGSRYYAPWRDDPRPASGLLQGVYAYLGVTGFWRGERRRGATGHADSEFARWRAAGLLGAETLLASGRLTTAGEDFVSGIRATLRAWEQDPVPAEALARAAADNEQHRTAWIHRNGPIPPST